MSFQDDFGESSLRRAVNACRQHYHAELNHQGLDNQRIDPHDKTGHGTARRRQRLVVMLSYYFWEAA